MAIVRLEVLKQLSAAITADVPDLAGKVCVGHAGASKLLSFPHMVILPIRWKYTPFQADEVHEPAADRVVMNVGYHQSIVQVRLGAKTQHERYALEQQVIDVFLSTPMRPGVLLTEVTSCPELGDFTASWELDNDEWEDAKAFDSQFYSIIVLDATIPALVTRTGAWTIEQIQLGITDMLSAVDADNFNTDPPVEVVQIHADGSISPADTLLGAADIAARVIAEAAGSYS